MFSQLKTFEECPGMAETVSIDSGNIKGYDKCSVVDQDIRITSLSLKKYTLL